MGSEALIPVVLPNYNVSTAGVNLGFGHAGFLLVSSDGSAKFYEYGLYKQDSFTITHSGSSGSAGNGNIRALDINAPMQFDSSGAITAASIKTALDVEWHKADTGVAVVSSFALSDGYYGDSAPNYRNQPANLVHCHRNAVIASAAKQSRLSPRKDSGLLRCARNDEALQT